jgi:hypothetical protein
MTKFYLLASLLLSSALPIFMSAAEPPAPGKSAPAVSPYAVLESFVGGVWSGALAPQKDGIPLRIELRFAWAENKQGMRFDSSFVKGEKRAPYTSGMYAWNAAKGKLVIFYTDSSASLSEGTIVQEENVLVHDFTVSNKDGTIDTARVRLTKVNADVFTNEIFLLKNDAWVKIVEVRYERHG